MIYSWKISRSNSSNCVLGTKYGCEPCFKPLIFGDKEDEGRTLALSQDSRELVERDNKERIKNSYTHTADHGLIYAPRQLSSNRRVRLANGRSKLPENSLLTLTTQPGRSSRRITTKEDPFNLYPDVFHPDLSSSPRHVSRSIRFESTRSKPNWIVIIKNYLNRSK